MLLFDRVAYPAHPGLKASEFEGVVVSPLFEGSIFCNRYEFRAGSISSLGTAANDGHFAATGIGDGPLAQPLKISIPPSQISGIPSLDDLELFTVFRLLLSRCLFLFLAALFDCRDEGREFPPDFSFTLHRRLPAVVRGPGREGE